MHYRLQEGIHTVTLKEEKNVGGSIGIHHYINMINA